VQVLKIAAFEICSCRDERVSGNSAGGRQCRRTVHAGSAVPETGPLTGSSTKILLPVIFLARYEPGIRLYLGGQYCAQLASRNAGYSPFA
jgi:hypothetical protein